VLQPRNDADQSAAPDSLDNASVSCRRNRAAFSSCSLDDTNKTSVIRRDHASNYKLLDIDLQNQIFRVESKIFNSFYFSQEPNFPLPVLLFAGWAIGEDRHEQLSFAARSRSDVKVTPPDSRRSARPARIR
jgi:hypothetical protein